MLVRGPLTGVCMRGLGRFLALPFVVLGLLLQINSPAHAQPASFEVAAALPGVTVTARPLATELFARSPATVESVDAERLRETVNVVNTEDALKYLPSLLVRKRHVGDTQAPLATRTSGVGASARSLIYADGVLLSALIGNNNSTASPRWGMVSPEEIERIDVAYGPFSAAFPGNSIGAVVEIATRMPDHLEGAASVLGSWQSFSQYATDGTYPAWQAVGTVGDRRGPFSWWLGANHVQSRSQPLAYVTAARPAAPGPAGAATTGSFADLNRTGAPIAVLGAGGFEDQAQDNLKLKLAFDATPHLRLAYSLGLFLNDTDSRVESYLRSTAGAPVYSGSLNLDGYPYTVAASAFSNNRYRFEERHWMHSLTAATDTGGAFDWRIAFSRYDYGKDEQRTPSTALPGAETGGAGSIVRLDGTGWTTFDAKGVWRPPSLVGHEIGFGGHLDRYELSNLRYNTADWIVGSPGALASAASGRTRNRAVWMQDAWAIRPDLTLTLGGRYEGWKAYDGFNYSASPALAVSQPSRATDRFSPKATLQWRIDPRWTLTGSFGTAWRFPTVSELYQAVATGPTLTVPNPNLRPERAFSEELALERHTGSGRIRLSLFNEDLKDALISQTAPLVASSTTLFSYVQNIDRVRSRGLELVVQQENVLIRGLEIGASLTLVEAEIRKDPAFPAAVGKDLPQVPRTRATVTATWRPDDRLALTLAARYSSRSYATIDNADPVTHTFQGFDPYLVLDARVSYRLNARWNAAIGVDNLNNDKYFLFHPFPQRTVSAGLEYRF